MAFAAHFYQVYQFILSVWLIYWMPVMICCQGAAVSVVDDALAAFSLNVPVS